MTITLIMQYLVPHHIRSIFPRSTNLLELNMRHVLKQTILTRHIMCIKFHLLHTKSLILFFQPSLM